MKGNSSKLQKICFDEFDFEDGIKQNEAATDILLSVRWHGGIYLKIKYTWTYFLTIERNDFPFYTQRFAKKDGHMLRSVSRCVKDIQSGRYSNKKTGREQIQEILICRGLTSFMNNTKWRELRTAMLEEMPFEPPYEYKTLLDDDDYINKDYIQYLIHEEGPNCFGNYDAESFNFLDYKSLEWMVFRPRFYTLEGGQLAKKQIWHDAEEAFVAILKKLNISYEIADGVYFVYGYR